MGRKRSQFKHVHVEGKVWTYQVGSSVVSIKDPQGKRTVVPRSKIVRGWRHNAEAGFDPDWAGPDRPRATFTYPTPCIVKNYIWRKLRPGGLIKEPRDLEQAKETILNFFLGDVPEQPIVAA